MCLSDPLMDICVIQLRLTSAAHQSANRFFRRRPSIKLLLTFVHFSCAPFSARIGANGINSKHNDILSASVFSQSVGKQLPNYTSSSYRPALSFIWSRISGQCTLSFSSAAESKTPEGNIWLLSC